jgi:hypothetical protein
LRDNRKGIDMSGHSEDCFCRECLNSTTRKIGYTVTGTDPAKVEKKMCCCPKENFRFGGIGCQCGGE